MRIWPGSRKHALAAVAARHNYRVPVEQEAVSLLDVESIMRAMRTLRSMPDRERRFFVVKRSSCTSRVHRCLCRGGVGAAIQPTPFDVSTISKLFVGALNRKGEPGGRLTCRLGPSPSTLAEAMKRRVAATRRHS